MSHAPRFHRLPVSELRREAPDAVSLTFAIPKELSGDYSFMPGQYLTLHEIAEIVAFRDRGQAPCGAWPRWHPGHSPATAGSGACTGGAGLTPCL